MHPNELIPVKGLTVQEEIIKEKKKERKEKQKINQKEIIEIYKTRLHKTDFKFKNVEYELLWKD